MSVPESCSECRLAYGLLEPCYLAQTHRRLTLFWVARSKIVHSPEWQTSNIVMGVLMLDQPVNTQAAGGHKQMHTLYTCRIPLSPMTGTCMVIEP